MSSNQSSVPGIANDHDRSRPEQSAGFPVVALGASAGGLEALGHFFDAVPKAGLGAAFVVVAHMDPDHASLLPELLQKHCLMPVVQIGDGMHVRPDHIYVIPPNCNLTIAGGILHLMAPRQRIGTTIDHFFQTLARDRGSLAVAIILSGTGSDGSQGCRDIKACRGLLMVQDMASAKYSGMPEAAIATGLADFVLPPGMMPEQLLEHFKHPLSRPTSIPADAGIVLPDALQKIFTRLHARTGHDFSRYKKSTINRRIERRMHIHHLVNIDDYVRYLQQSDDEATALFNELLIGVTSMFRDPDAFAALQREAILPLMAARPADSTLRVWVAGCSTGEEAYSIAILMLECMQTLQQHFHLQIFATDIDEKAIAIARTGIYPAAIEADIGKQRLTRYFDKMEDGRYRISKSVREKLVFAQQNIIKDPPFTRLDLICCRNLMIYLETALQKKLLPLFHYSLLPGGILFLGSSETIGQSSDYFSVLDKQWKIYSTLPAVTSRQKIPIIPGVAKNHDDMEAVLPTNIHKLEAISAFQLVAAILQQSDAPPCAIINAENDIVYIHGKTGRFLEPPEGRISVNILEMARPGLKKELADAIRQVGIHQQEVRRPALNVRFNGDFISVDLTVKPIREPAAIPDMIMVVFEELSRTDLSSPSAVPSQAKSKRRSVAELEQELQFSRDSLQITIEKLEAANEALKSANEELQSTNEELQSTNEELETSKEELQSLNEESSTVNVELQSRIDELSQANDDLKNLLDSTEVATIFLDSDLLVRRFTPRVTELVPLEATDIGRPIKHFATSLVEVDLSADAKKVLDELNVIDREVSDKGHLIYRMRIRPYRTVNNVIDGVVLTFDDITASRRAQQLIVREKQFAENILATIHQPLIVLDSHLLVVSANPSFFRHFPLDSRETIGKSIFELSNGQWNSRELRELLENILPANTTIENYRLEHLFESIGKRTLLLNARRIKAEQPEQELILLAIGDIGDIGNSG